MLGGREFLTLKILFPKALNSFPHLLRVKLDVVLVHDVDEVLQPNLVVVVVVQEVQDPAERLLENVRLCGMKSLKISDASCSQAICLF